ncbi:MAG: hypothetical protein WD273_10140 [Trueperaceae bacterium]
MIRIEPGDALGQLPATLRDELLTTFNSIVQNYAQGRWEPSELNGGKLCEVVYTILHGHVEGHYPPRSSKPRNMVNACRDLEQATGSPRSIRIQVPRVLVALYEIRNNRGVGHVGGDVDPNHMDATFVLESSKWLVAELVRLFHKVDLETATATVEALVERTVPVIWRVGDLQRVLEPSLSQRDQTLLLLYGSSNEVDESSLLAWVEAANPRAYRSQVLRRLHKERLVEYDHDTQRIRISPAGIAYVEENLPLTLAPGV